MIVRAEKVQRRIEQACFLQSEKHWISALRGTEAAGAESLVRLAWIFFLVRQTDLEAPLSTALKHTQHVSRLRDLPARNRIEQTQETFRALLFFSAGLQECLRRARFAIALAEARIFQMETAVVVEGGAPEHRAMRHHAA